MRTIQKGWSPAVWLALTYLLPERVYGFWMESGRFEFTDVPPPTTPTLYVVLGLCGTCILESFVIAFPSAYAGLTRPNDPKL